MSNFYEVKIMTKKLLTGQVAKKYTTASYKETQKLGKKLAKKILLQKQNKIATVLGLYGDLGGGKTTFLQGFAKGLKIKDKILSPTFVIFKKFQIPPIVKSTLPRVFCDGYFYHIDCYRINKPEEILELGFKKIISDPKNIVAVEWPEKIKKYLPKNTIKIEFKFIDKNKREIVVR
mgnify:CR=1 FL=1